jgi:hypothetical protein
MSGLAGPGLPVQVTVPAELSPTDREQIAAAVGRGISRVLGALALPGQPEVSVAVAGGYQLGLHGEPPTPDPQAEHQARALTTGCRFNHPGDELPALDGPAQVSEFAWRWAAAVATARAADLAGPAQVSALWAELRALRTLPGEPPARTGAVLRAVIAAGTGLGERLALADALADLDPGPAGAARAAEYVAARSGTDRLALVTHPASAAALVRVVHAGPRTVDQFYAGLLGQALSALLPSPRLTVDDDLPPGFVAVRMAGLDTMVLPLPDPGTMLMPAPVEFITDKGSGLLAAAVIPGLLPYQLWLVADDSEASRGLAAEGAGGSWYLGFFLSETAAGHASRLVSQSRLATFLDRIYNDKHAGTVWFARHVFAADELVMAVRQALRSGVAATALPLLLRHLTLQEPGAALDDRVTAAIALTRDFLGAAAPGEAAAVG